MNITIIGTGYVGLVSGTCLAHIGHTVTCIDKNKQKINNLKDGIIPIYEDKLNEYIHQNVSENRLFFNNDLSSVPDADAIFIAVGTPTAKDGQSADLSYVFSAVEDIAPLLKNGTTVVIKSTVPVGTNQRAADIIQSVNPDVSFNICFNPEFLREGNAIGDFMKPDRIVSGAHNKQTHDVMRRIYTPLIKNGAPFITTDINSAELIKYAANAFLATKIGFINEMSDLCEAVGADVSAVAHGMGSDARIGMQFLNPGPGYGGSCFPKDTRSLAKTATDQNVSLSIVNAVIKGNVIRKQQMADRIKTILNNDLTGKKIAVWGLAFKANTDDMRDAPALDIIPALIDAGAHIRAYDPAAMDEATEYLGNNSITYCDSPINAAKDVDAVVILTEWNIFKALDLTSVYNIMAAPVFIDLRNIIDIKAIQELPINYYGIGQAPILNAPDSVSTSDIKQAS